ncbi:methionine/alanine import family NSS transporter small subunit [Schaalia canis]|uniref:Methionine/alanine import family NSS transporter small subunit n=1 Tax=Schaalia canis TaxID=100469 RepID=A0A3P1SHD0_9ACTO|nr:methionine/alanine import family NSS transporter small subunit [Schaalia canis]RRC96329.1 methionine/alanine import family NSS transporter small subunit [Schaalia canis]
MTAPAIVMMVVTILLVWGGLVASVVALRGVNMPQQDEDAPVATGDVDAPQRH